MVAINVARWNNSLAVYESPTTGLMGATYVSSFFGDYKIPGTGGPTEGVQCLVRTAFASATVIVGCVKVDCAG